ncbi:hypothetical protein J437_LFUL005333 [Ladona fulva]|uniref:Ig-like domain-containing protein n=1 Tax=Ladona fulva TaxID=123851 RepID=A0A8K0NYR4_LADFU|nr:hypothetical protein J437_LFUL005333 [Ladona fulva]
MVQCRITDGIPSPKLTWTRVDGRPFSPNVEEPQLGVLRFNQVSGPESGQYLCRAENDAGSASAIATLEIQSLPQITLKYPGSESDGGRRQYHVKPGQRVRMECSADGDPAPSVFWNRHHPGYPRYGGYGAETKESAVYEITRASLSDSGTYSCEARNAVGTTQERLQLIVDEDAIDGENTINNRKPGRPYPTDTGVRLNNEKFTVLEGGSVTMRCSVEDNRETIFLTWIRGNQQPMPSEHRIQDGTLYINNVRPDAAGEYICQGIGQSGNILFTASSHLEVIEQQQVIRAAQRDVSTYVGSSVELRCSAQPGSRVHWTRDGNQPLPLNVRQRDDRETGQNILELYRVSVEDGGRYLCHSESPRGTTSDYVDLRIDRE